ncbi:MAG: type IV pilus secretin PilQ [Bradymonadaceae bacterium]
MTSLKSNRSHEPSTADARDGGSRQRGPSSRSAGSSPSGLGRASAVGRTAVVAVTAALLCLAGPGAASAQSSSDGGDTNVVSELQINEKSDGTYLRLSSSQTPSFSVFKLRDPLRLVVDVSNSRLKAESGARRVDNGVLSKVAVLESKEDGRSRVRLIVGFEQAAHYDVRTKGKDVVIFVESQGERRKSEDVAQIKKELKAKERQLARTRSKLDRLQAKYDSKLKENRRKYRRASEKLNETKSKLQAARREARQLENRVENAKGKVRERLESKLEAKNSRVQSLESSLQSRQQKLEKLRARTDELRRQRDRNRQKLETLEKRLAAQKQKLKKKQKRLAELREDKKEWSQKLAKTQTKYREATAELSQMKEKLKSARSEVEQLRKEKKEAVGDTKEKLQDELQSREQAIAELEKKLEKRQSSADELRKRVEKLEAERQRARKNLDQLRAKLDRQQKRTKKKTKQLQQAEKKAASLERQREQLEQKLARRQEKLQKMRRKMESRDQRLASLEQRVEKLQSQRSGEETVDADRLAELKKQLERERRRARKLTKARQRQAKKLEQLKADRRETEQQLERARNRSASSQQGEAKGRPARAVPMNEKGPNTIRDIRLVSREGESRIIVEMDRPGQYQRLPWKDSRAVMLLNNVELPDELQKTIRSDGASGAVQFVSSWEESKRRVRMEAAVQRRAKERIEQKGNKLIWEFAPKVSERPPARARRSSSRPPRRPTVGTARTSAPPSSGGGSDYPSVVIDPAKVRHVPGMSKKELTIDLRGADIQNVLRLFAKEGGVNIIAGDQIKGTVTLQLRGVPLDQAFLIVLQSQGLGFELRGDVIRVAPQSELRKERKARRKARERQQKTRPLEVFLMPVNYADAGDMVKQVKRLLSPRGSVSVDSRTNTLIIKDLPENIRSIRQLVNSLDTQVPQVLIEARIVETNDTFSQELGIQWGGDFTASQANGNPTGLAFPNVLGVSGGATDGRAPTRGTSSNPNFAVNLPAPAGTGSGGSLGLTMGSVNNSVNLNLRLSAAEESGRAKIVSAPKILTLDNEQATISQGTSIPISVVSAAGVQTVFVDATLELTVTPHVTPDGNIQLEIQASKSEPDFQNTGARGDPTILRKEAETELLIGDGETTVIGGIYTRNSGSSVTGVPFFRRIPILGWLFKKSSKSESRSELLIFITPRVVNRSEALSGTSNDSVTSSGGGGVPAKGGKGNKAGGTGAGPGAGGAKTKTSKGR